MERELGWMYERSHSQAPGNDTIHAVVYIIRMHRRTISSIYSYADGFSNTTTILSRQS